MTVVRYQRLDARNRGNRQGRARVQMGVRQRCQHFRLIGPCGNRCRARGNRYGHRRRDFDERKRKRQVEKRSLRRHLDGRHRNLPLRRRQSLNHRPGNVIVNGRRAVAERRGRNQRRTNAVPQFEEFRFLRHGEDVLRGLRFPFGLRVRRVGVFGSEPERRRGMDPDVRYRSGPPLGTVRLRNFPDAGFFGGHGILNDQRDLSEPYASGRRFLRQSHRLRHRRKRDRDARKDAVRRHRGTRCAGESPA